MEESRDKKDTTDRFYTQTDRQRLHRLYVIESADLIMSQSSFLWTEDQVQTKQ